MEHLNSSPSENEPTTPQQLAELVLQSAGVGEEPMTFAQRAEVLRGIKLAATTDIMKGVDTIVYASAVSHAVELTDDPLLKAAQHELQYKLQRRNRLGL